MKASVDFLRKGRAGTGYFSFRLLLPACMVLLLLLSLPSTIFAGPDDSLRVADILHRLEKINAGHQLVRYTGHRIITSHGMDDSVSQATSTVWIETRRQDPFFGARFHLRGNDGREDLDYYYDGQRAYEYRHGRKELLVVDPKGFDNTPNNPAKARTSLRALDFIFIDTAVARQFLRPGTSVSLLEEAGSYRISFVYPDTKELKWRKWLLLSSDSLRVLEIGSATDFNGSLQTQVFKTIDMRFNHPEDLDSVYLREPVGVYAKTERLRPETMKPADRINLAGKTATDFSFVSLTGSTEKLSGYRGKYVLIDFWESWCGYCIQAIPKKDSLYRAMRDKGLVVLGVTTENRNQVRKLAERNQVSYPTLLADESVIAAYKVTARPTYVLVGPDGQIIANGEGNLDEMIGVISKRLRLH